MGMYMYRVTAKVVTLADGRKAHVAKYAYKPFWSDALNVKQHFRTGCVASERMELKAELLVTMDAEDALGTLYANPHGLRTFLDDCTFGTEKMPRLGGVVRNGRNIEVTP